MSRWKVRPDHDKRRAEVFLDNRPVAFEDLAIEYRGKRRMLVLTIADIEILRDSACPERHRYFRITQALGDPDKVAELQTECSKLKLNCRACDGCPERPF